MSRTVRFFSPRTLLLVGVLSLVLRPATLSCQHVQSVTVRLDNDILALRGTGAPPDYDYTHGMRIALGLAGAPVWGRLLAPGLGACATDSAESRSPCLATTVGLGQRIYTPRRDAPEPLPGERPYAAWLYASAEGRIMGGRRTRTFGIEVGVTGPPALGEPVQNGVHRLLGSERQEGWEHQLAFEPGVVARYREAYRIERRIPGLGAAAVAPGAGVALGNVLTAADVGVGFTLARADDDGIAGEGTARGPYLLAGARGEWVLRNVFLDGNTFGGEDFEVRKKPLVGEGEVGLGWGFRRWSLDYRHVVRTREYRTQPGPHGYGSLTLRLFPGRRD